MKIFISGATGVLGRRVVKLLIAHGHPVVGLSRSASNTTWLTQNGAEARTGDLFNPEQICELSADCDAILHLATAIPTKARTSLADWTLNDRIRREGTQSLLKAAIHNQGQLYLQQSVLLAYGDRAGAWVDEQTPLASPSRVLRSAVEMEQLVTEAHQTHDLPTLTLRFGTFYAHDAAATQAMFRLIRQGFFPLIGDGLAYTNLINIDDAARAVLQAIKTYPNGVGQTLNVCDDEPVTYREATIYLAELLDARHPRSLPPFLANLLAGSHAVEVLLASVRCHNQQAKATLGWTPQYPTYREGYLAEVEQWLKPSQNQSQEQALWRS